MAIDVKEAPVAAVLENKPALAPGAVVSEGEKRAAEIRKKVAAEPPKSIREYFKERSTLPPSKEQIKHVIDLNFASGIDTATGDPYFSSHGEEARHENVSDITSEIRAYLDSKNNPAGYNGAISRRFEHEVGDLLKSIPRFSEYFATMSDADAEATIKSLLGNPEFAAQVNQAFHEKLKSASNGLPEKVEFQKAFIQKEKISNEIVTHRAEDAGVDGQISITETQLNSFSETGGPGGTQGALYTEIQGLQGTQAEDQLMVRDMQDQITAIDADIRALRLNDKRGRNAAVIAGLQADRARCVADKRASELKLNRLSELNAQQEKLLNTRAQLQQMKVAIFGKIKELESIRTESQISLSGKQTSLDNAQQELINGFKATLTESAGRFLSEKMESADQAAVLAEEEDVKRITEEVDKKFLESVHRRWSKTKEVGGVFSNKRETIVTDHALVQTDYERLIKEGPEGMMREILTSNGLSTEKIEEKINDHEFMNKMQPKLVEGLLRRKLKDAELGHGKKMTGEEAMAISETPWGEQAILAALHKNSEINNMMTELKNSGVISGNTPKEWFKEENKGSRLKLFMLMLFGITVIPAFVDGYRKALNKQMIGAEE